MPDPSGTGDPTSGARRRGTSSAFDRVDRTRRTGHGKDATGKEALFSTAPSSAPPRPLEVTCRACGVSTAVDLGSVVTLLRPPFLYNPVRASLWTRCPHCGERAWLDLALGQAIRALLGRTMG